MKQSHQNSALFCESDLYALMQPDARKLLALLMAALLLPAYAEEGDVAEIAEIAGTVLEIGEESILLETPEV